MSYVNRAAQIRGAFHLPESETGFGILFTFLYVIHGNVIQILTLTHGNVIQILTLTLVLMNLDIPCLCKQCISRSVGF